MFPKRSSSRGEEMAAFGSSPGSQRHLPVSGPPCTLVPRPGPLSPCSPRHQLTPRWLFFSFRPHLECHLLREASQMRPPLPTAESDSYSPPFLLPPVIRCKDVFSSMVFKTNVCLLWKTSAPKGRAVPFLLCYVPGARRSASHRADTQCLLNG